MTKEMANPYYGIQAQRQRKQQVCFRLSFCAFKELSFASDSIFWSFKSYCVLYKKVTIELFIKVVGVTRYINALFYPTSNIFFIITIIMQVMGYIERIPDKLIRIINQ